jgi:aspartate/methionine/tyrosine aminotransferase
VRNIVFSQLESIDDICAVPRADGAFYFLLRVASELSPMTLAEKLIREHRVAVIPGSAFGFETGCHLRVSYGALTPETASEGVARLIEGIRLQRS